MFVCYWSPSLPVNDVSACKCIFVYVHVQLYYSIQYGTLVFNPISSHSKDTKIIHDASLFNSQHYKVQNKDKRSNPGNWVALYPRPRTCTYWKGSLSVTLDYRHQVTIYIYIYIYIYTYVCVGGGGVRLFKNWFYMEIKFLILRYWFYSVSRKKMLILFCFILFEVDQFIVLIIKFK